MIKFFRRIRKNLLMENKTGKYLKYAVGEIVLVVIGILIALQINTWKKNNDKRVQEITILKNIQEDISLDTLDLDFNLSYHLEFIKNEQALLDFLMNNLTQPEKTIDYSSALGFKLIVALHESTYENLQNNEIGILSNNELKKEISRFYDFFTDALLKLENEEISYNTYLNKKPFFQKHFKLTTGSQKNGNEIVSDEYYNPAFQKNILEIIDVDVLKQDEAFKLELSESIFVRKVKIDFYKNHLQRIKQLNISIEKELDNLSN